MPAIEVCQKREIVWCVSSAAIRGARRRFIERGHEQMKRFVKKYAAMAAAVMVALTLAATGAMADTTEVGNFSELKEALAKGGSIILKATVTGNEQLVISKDVNIDLRGNKIIFEKPTVTPLPRYAIYIKDGAVVNLTSTGSNGEIYADNPADRASYGDGFQQGIRVEGNISGSNPIKTELTVENVKIQGCIYGITVYGVGAILNIKDGSDITGYGMGISGNGTPGNGGTTINIFGGTISSTANSQTVGDVAIYHPQAGTLNISGGTISGYDGIQLKAGGLAVTNITGGEIKATGENVVNLADNSNGSVTTGAAISLIGNSGYAGNMSLNISGNAAKVTSAKGYAIRQEITVGGSDQVSSIKISAGTISGGAGALKFNNYLASKYVVTGGVYSSDPTAYLAKGYIARGTSDGKQFFVTPEAFDKNMVISKSSLSLNIEDSYTLIAAAPITDEPVTWSSDTPAVAAVDQNGKITAVKAGIAVITALGDASKTSAGCTVTVADPAKPDPVPTPGVVTAEVVTSADNPVAKEENVPADVKPVTPVIAEATNDNKAEIAKNAGVSSEDLKANDKGQLIIAPTIAKAAVESVMSADAAVKPTQIVSLPIVTAKVAENKVAALAFKVKGAELGATANSVVSDITLIKVLKDKTGAKFTYVSDPAAYATKCFTLKGSDGKSLARTDKVDPTAEYTLVVFIKDNDADGFDYDERTEYVIDPLAIATNAASEPAPASGGSSGGGCSAGFPLLALLVLAPLAYRRKR